MSVGLGGLTGKALLAPAHDACCSPSAEVTATNVARHKRLGDLSTVLHCSIIGTCLGSADLRKLMQRYGAVEPSTTDLDVHHYAVELAGRVGPATKALQKALDDRHALAIRKFARAKDEATLRAWWSEAVRTGDIPGPYWAVMTHPVASVDLRQLVFGDVHMLSHLVGAANRADIRRLVALEHENNALKEKVERQQERLQAAAVDHQTLVVRLQAEAIASPARAAQHDDDATLQSAQGLRDIVAERDRQVAVQTRRRERAEQSAAMMQSEASRLTAELEHAHRFIETLQAELHAVEQQLLDEGDAGEGVRILQRLAGRRILYVGGRPRSNVALRALAARHGIVLGMHDGGIEDRKGLLGAAIPGSELVVFPADCIDHDSMNQLRRQCERHGVPYQVLRSASVASFVAAMTALISEPDDHAAPSSRFCRRHG